MPPRVNRARPCRAAVLERAHLARRETKASRPVDTKTTKLPWSRVAPAARVSYNIRKRAIPNMLALAEMDTLRGETIPIAMSPIPVTRILSLTGSVPWNSC